MAETKKCAHLGCNCQVKEGGPWGKYCSPLCAAHRDAASDADAFERAMADVVRLGPDPRGRIRAAPPVNATPAATSPAEEGEESGQDYAAPGVDRREIRRLKRAAYVVGYRRDLHAMTAAEPCATVRRSIENSRHRPPRGGSIAHRRR